MLDGAVRSRGLTAAPCRTRDLPPIDAPGNPGAAPTPVRGLPESLVARYGAEAADVLAAATCTRSAEPVAGGIDVIRAEFEYADVRE